MAEGEPSWMREEPAPSPASSQAAKNKSAQDPTADAGFLCTKIGPKISVTMKVRLKKLVRCLNTTLGLLFAFTSEQIVCVNPAYPDLIRLFTYRPSRIRFRSARRL
jgi:hypothetical protein